LLHQGSGSTIDHFLRGPLERDRARIVEIDSGQPPDWGSRQALQTCRSVVVVRYVPRRWISPLERARKNGTSLTYLMDDDLLDPDLMGELPTAYRQRLWDRITRQRQRVPALFDRVWVTSAFLAHKYAHLGAKCLPLLPHPSLLEDRPRLQLAYLGTSVHAQEFAWLRELLAVLQARQPHTHVDLFGDLTINRQFRDLPRIRILHPMAWPSYLAETGRGRVDLLLTPLLPTRFNAAKAAVKVVDAARCGAAGLYSDRPPYRGFIRHGIDGLLLADSHQDWLEAIEGLIDDPSARRRLADGGRERALRLSRGDSREAGADWPLDGLP
jgi:glycosyltransferase involved in cell wall biosynthesis